MNKTLATGLMVLGMSMMTLPSYAQATTGEGLREKPVLSAEKIAQFEKKKAARDVALHDKLNITTAQEDAWKAFVKVKQFSHQPGERHLSKDERAKLTTPERLEQQLARMKQGEIRLVERIAATKALYAVLTVEQRQTFDAQSDRGHHRHAKKRHHGGSHPDSPEKG